ncbi:MAG TPA: amidinotransferase, partial [Saprospiraceae bacterium]|nr:amidinotransferase [Saprospiraceae bacterium]
MKPIQQITNTLMMIRPANFGYNVETAQNNAFQTNDTGEDTGLIAQKARAEFDLLVQKLEDHGVEVVVIEDTPTPVKPDAVFPNNWISFHQDGSIMTYPMFSQVRRLERRADIIDKIKENFTVLHQYSFESYETDEMYLEGTGSMILDRPNKLVYACTSIRTNEDILDEFSRLTGYQKILFQSTDEAGQEIYHTNVMMAMGTSFVVICMESIRDEQQRQLLRDTFKTYHKEV